MTTEFTRFCIEGLHNRKTFDIPIRDNRLVLVGENGIGKSTVANFIYFFLTTQWQRMLGTTFKSVAADVNGREFVLTREDIEQLAQRWALLEQLHLPPSLHRELETVLNLESQDAQNEHLKQLESRIGLPARILQRQLTRLERDSLQNPTLVRWLRSEIEEQILYLPTYRRIEQDLETIFRDADITKQLRTQLRVMNRHRRVGHIELVAFGMEDVEKIIERRMVSMKENVRQDLSNLTGAYLRDIIQGIYKDESANQLRNMETYSVDDILKRIPKEILPDRDKLTLRSIIEQMNTSGKVDDENRVVAHFLVKLIELYEKQQQDEKDIREFVQVCNDGYLSGKRLVYDDVAFAVYIEQDNGVERVQPVSMQSLSSGEKQIISLFSHLYLGDRSDFIVIIDEPELSLSVPWQQRFLPDILKRANGLIAVTHSPFIYDNELMPYTHSLEEFIEPFDYDPALESTVSALERFSGINAELFGE